MNSTKVISFQNIGKQYALNANTKHYFREFLVDLVKAKSTKRKDFFWALQNISFDVKQGEIIGIIGKNGAGKSTLLKILSKITKPTTGRIEMEGKLAALLEVGTGFHPELTGRENIYLNGTILGMSRNEIKSKLDEIITFSEVEKFIDTPVKHYSSGMYVRLAFSIAAHVEPDILVIDEVLSVGDLEFQKKCLGKMDDVSKSGRTILFVSHDMGTVAKLCTSGILLDKGQIMHMGTVEECTEIYTGIAAKGNEISLSEQNENGYPTKIELYNGSNLKTASFPIGEKIKIVITIKIEKSMPHFIAGVGILNALGTRISTGYTAPQAVDPGEYTVEYIIDNIFLESNSYSITVGLSNNEFAIFYKPNLITFEIIDWHTSIKELNLVRTKNVGVVLNLMSSKISKNN